MGVQGSTTPLAGPFDRHAAHYPSADYTPFFENAALVAHKLAGWPWTVTFGRQSYTMGSGLLLDDNGAGLAGVSAKGGFAFAQSNGVTAFSGPDGAQIIQGEVDINTISPEPSPSPTEPSPDGGNNDMDFTS